LVAAYLIVVKRVQVTLFRKLNTFLFGEEISENPVSQKSSGLLSVAKPAPAGQTFAPRVSPAFAGADSFILNQISRGRHN
jgi:hypothetical protein